MLRRHFLPLLTVTILGGCVDAGGVGDPEIPLRDEAGPESIESLGGPDLGTELSLVPADDAAVVADRFVEVQAARSVPGWSGAVVGEPRLYVDGASVPYLFEVPVLDAAGRDAGYVQVGAREGVGVVLGYFSQGAAPAQALLDGARARFQGRLAEGDVTFLADGPLFLGVRFSAEPAQVSPGEGTFVDEEAGSVLHAPALLDAGAWAAADWPGPAETRWEDLAEERATRRAFLDYDARHLPEVLGLGEFTAAVTAPGQAASGTVDVGVSAFSNWYQESRSWTSGTCYTGCAPVAMGILMEYYDRHLWGSIIASDADNSNTSHTDSDSRWTLDELRKGMGTWCSGSTGSTYTSKVDDGGDSYAAGRGYVSWAFDNDVEWYTGETWPELRGEIDAERPVVAHLSNWNGGHSVVVYAYEDHSGSSNDTVCVKTGWASPNQTSCFTRRTYTWDRITMVQPH
ncbi:C39 family peptidase [Myxococcota bacterium]|nr:C39 family peptidase [Myxococcota bacterium]